ncbi:MAG: ATP-binding domain-containing protein [Limnobacter sp.]|uniref:ATP-binding domain-containing protein n=1 Tax=Limnobacter sp. TaxID=2003368 RepID=UPI0032EB9DBF
MSATVYPSDTSELALDGAQARERDVLLQLQAQLPDNYTIYHGIHWSRIEHGLTVTGRIQFLVLGPSGIVYCILMKTGLMKVDQGRVVKQLGEQRQDVFNALAEQGALLVQKFKKQHQGTLRIEPVFYCPDFTVPDATGLTVNAERVVDARHKDELAALIQTIDITADLFSSHSNPKAIHSFLCNELNLVPEVGALSQVAETLVTRLSQGLEQWVSRLDFEPFRLRVAGTAGSGKSQLAFSELQRNHGLKARTLYVCYNRPLSSHMAQQVRQAGLMGAVVFNFHALCDRMLRDAGQDVDYSSPGVFGRLAEQVLATPVDKRWVFDSIVVDEGQDFDQSWLAVLQRCAHSGTRWLWLEDPIQNLYGKPSISLPGWVSLNTPMNYRNPKRVVQALQLVQQEFRFESPLPLDIEAACPLEGLPLEFFEYEDNDGLLNQTAKAITACLRHGFTRDKIAVLSMRGHEKSKVLAQASLGPHSLRHFTGRYDEHGGQVFTEGNVHAESVYRFKGQSAQAVVVTELAFEEFNETDFRKLFVAMTRAKLLLVLVGHANTLGRLRNAIHC